MDWKTTSLSPFYLIAVLLVSCNTTTHDKQESGAVNDSLAARECIQQVIALDDSLGTVRNHACETLSLSETIRQYAASMAQIDFTDCPDGFAKAFEKHRKAWLAMVAVTDNHPDLRGELHALFDQIEKGKDSSRFKPLLKDIWDTWDGVESFNQK